MSIAYCLLLFLCVGSYGADVFEQVAALTCEGELFLYPDHPVVRTRLNVSSLKEGYELAVQRMYERYQCPCPGISTDEIDRDRAYYTPEFWLNKLTKQDNRTTCYQWQPPPNNGYSYYPPFIQAIQKLLQDFDLSHIDWSTCNSDTWKSGKGCAIQLYLPSVNIYLQVAGKKCSASQYWPYASLSCKGQMCSKLMMPCNSQTECGASRCHGIGYRAGENNLVGVGDLLQTLREVLVFDDNDGDDTDPAVAFYEGLLTWGRKLVYLVSPPFKFSPAYYPFVDFSICSPSLDALSADFSQACVSNNKVVYCDQISSWNGLLGDGSSVLSADRVSGNRWRTGNLTQQDIVLASPDNEVIADYSCSGQLAVLPYLPFALPGLPAGIKLMGNTYHLYGQPWLFLMFMQPAVLNAPWINQALSIAYNYLLGVEQERALLRGSTLSPQAFEFTWSWQQFLYDWVYAPAGNPPVDHGPDMSSLRQWLMTQVLYPEGMFYQITLPSSCTYERWATEGKCSGDYTGFGDLLGIDLTLRVSAKTCGSVNAVPSFQIQCVGAACRPLSVPVSCTSSSDCARGFLCQPLTSQVLSNYNFDPLFFTAIAEYDTYYYINDTRNAKCAGTSYYLKDTVYFLDKLGQTVQGSPSICMVNYTILQSPSGYYPVINSWVGRAFGGIKDIGNVQEVILNFFSNWLN